MVSASDEMEVKVVRQLGRAMQPLLTNVSADWGALTPRLLFPAAPLQSTPLYPGGRSVLYAVVDAGSTGAGGTWWDMVGYGGIWWDMVGYGDSAATLTLQVLRTVQIPFH